MVGFKKPPVHSRFKPGTSGNPLGRPKNNSKFRNLQDIINHYLYLKVTITINGKSIRVSYLEAIFMRQIEQALKGDPRSLKTIIKLIEQYKPTLNKHELFVSVLMKAEKLEQEKEEAEKKKQEEWENERMGLINKNIIKK